MLAFLPLLAEAVAWRRAGRVTVMLKQGDKAPGFTLLDQDGKSINLADLTGRKVLVYFYP